MLATFIKITQTFGERSFTLAKGPCYINRKPKEKLYFISGPLKSFEIQEKCKCKHIENPHKKTSKFW